MGGKGTTDLAVHNRRVEMGGGIAYTLFGVRIRGSVSWFTLLPAYIAKLSEMEARNGRDIELKKKNQVIG